MNKVRIVEKRASDIINLDYNYLGSQMLLDPNKAARVIAKYAGGNTFLGFFARFGISSEDGPSITKGTYDELVYRWRVKVDEIAPLTITESVLPATITAGQTFSGIRTDEGWVMKDAILMSEDSKHQFLLIRKTGVGMKRDFGLELQYISWDNTKVLTRRELLAVGRTLNYVNNAKGERSSTSQEFKGGNSFELANIFTTSRHKIQASGHGLSNATWTAYECLDNNGNVIKEESSFLPMQEMTLKNHFKHIALHALVARTNYDPLTQTINNVNPYSENGQEIPIGSGAEEQMQSTENAFSYPINARPGDKARFLDKIIGAMDEYHRDNMGSKKALVVMTENGGAAWLESAFEEKRLSQGQQIRLTDDGKGVHAGLVNTEYRTRLGTLTVLNTGYSKPRSFGTETAMFNGQAYDRDSFNMYFLPIFLSKTDQSRYNFRLMTKKKGNLSRALVIGQLNGMTGFNGNTMEVDGIASSANNESFAASVAKNGYSVASAVDGETMMALSEWMVVVDSADDVFWAQPDIFQA